MFFLKRMFLKQSVQIQIHMYVSQYLLILLAQSAIHHFTYLGIILM